MESISQLARAEHHLIDAEIHLTDLHVELSIAEARVSAAERLHQRRIAQFDAAMIAALSRSDRS